MLAFFVRHQKFQLSTKCNREARNPLRLTNERWNKKAFETNPTAIYTDFTASKISRAISAERSQRQAVLVVRPQKSHAVFYETKPLCVAADRNLRMCKG